jgi:hypothetical protein
MSHFLPAENILESRTVNEFVRYALSQVLRDGYSLQDPGYPPEGKYGVEIVINRIGDGPESKKLLFEAAMHVMQIPFSRPCGLTYQVNTTFRAEAREFKKLLHRLSGFAPEKDTCIRVCD